MAAVVQTISSEKLLLLLSQRGISLTDQRLRQLAKENVFPNPTRGQYEFLATLLGLIKHYAQLYQKKSGTILEEQLRIQIGKRKIIEVQASDAENEVEQIAEVERSRIALVVMIRQKLLALPAKASSYLACCSDQKEMEVELEKQIEKILSELEQPAFTARPDTVAENGAAQ